MSENPKPNDDDENTLDQLFEKMMADLNPQERLGLLNGFQTSLQTHKDALEYLDRMTPGVVNRILESMNKALHDPTITKMINVHRQQGDADQFLEQQMVLGFSSAMIIIDKTKGRKN